MMYQVIEMYGDNEPWWFFEGWKDDIIDSHQFNNLADALLFYNRKLLELKSTHEIHKEHVGYLNAFWDHDDDRWCEECEDFLQQYFGLLLLKDGQVINLISNDNAPGLIANSKKYRCCKINYENNAQ
ncbi:DUF1033 family protein [Enterococcus sp. MMGLQ5-1]|uniref:DUF1033 family protein n=2 Tax=unclassified Enterococcus TaxID=2608891 RepID=UPI001BD168BC|nr:DUF1033 family protein [Enterococcus sp. MMGLQ5-1]